MSNFEGIPKAGLKFLRQLEKNNTREWFEAHKQTYEDELLAPSLALVTDLGARLKAISKGIIADTRTNGSGSLMRIYRDTRFSKDKSPYKTNITMMFWEGPVGRPRTPVLACASVRPVAA